MSKKLVSIPKPCDEDISQMRHCNTGKHCAVCKADIFDLRKKDLATVHKIIEANPGACVIVNDRHTLESKGWPYTWVNRMEAFLNKYKLAALASVLIPSVLFLSGCKRHTHKVGKLKNPAYKMPEQKTAEEKAE